jgi:hypothetical protein
MGALPSAANILFGIMAGSLNDLNRGYVFSKGSSRRKNVLKLRILWGKLSTVSVVISFVLVLQMIFETSF